MHYLEIKEKERGSRNYSLNFAVVDLKFAKKCARLKSELRSPTHYIRIAFRLLRDIALLKLLSYLIIFFT